MAPIDLSIRTAFDLKLSIREVPASKSATKTYHAISITLAMIAIIARSKILISLLMNWLNTATRNTRILGLRNAIINPSINPFFLISFSLETSDCLLMIILYAIHNNMKAPAN